MSKGSFHARVWPKLVLRASSLMMKGDRILVAVSGGPDSVCLLDFLARWRERRQLTLFVAHFDHGLRRSSRADAAFVRKAAGGLGIEARVERLPVRERARRERKGLEDAGRALRYEALDRLARELGCNKVATGHQQGDQAETVLLHLLRGTSAEGLAGIPARRALGRGVEVVRPLLSLTRAEVLEYLRYRGLAWREDPTNQSQAFRGNWGRAELLPLLERRAPGASKRLAAMAEAVRAGLRSTSTPADAGRARGRSTARRRRPRRDA